MAALVMATAKNDEKCKHLNGSVITILHVVLNTQYNFQYVTMVTTMSYNILFNLSAGHCDSC